MFNCILLLFRALFHQAQIGSVFVTRSKNPFQVIMIGNKPLAEVGAVNIKDVRISLSLHRRWFKPITLWSTSSTTLTRT